MRSRLLAFGAVSAALLALLTGGPALAQSSSDDGAKASEASDATGADKPAARGSSKRGARKASGRPGVRISPYIEASQIATAELSPGNDVLTYTRLAAGVDADMVGRNSAASLSLRYEHYFGWGKKAGDGDVVSGIVRGYTTLAEGLQIEGGALASRSQIDGNGISGAGGIGGIGASNRIYSAYVGPALTKQVGDLRIDGSYQFGYTRVEEPDATVITPGASAIDVFEDSFVHQANLRAGIAPYTVLPVGLGIGGGFYQEDVSNLDQRARDIHVRADITVPITLDLALLGGVGYEDVEISSRDVLRDGSGLPVIGSDGRFVTDKSSPRSLAFDVDGFIWDAGVLWRPSRRTSLEAHVGRRYGSTTYYGTFSYSPNARSSITASVYDNIGGLGGQIGRALADLPIEFQVTRDPITGELTGCVSSLDQGNCLVGILGSIRSSVFRARGYAANYTVQLGRISAGVGAGFDRRKFIGAPGTILEQADGVVDENIWISAFLNSRIGERGTLATNAYANWFDSGSAFGGKSNALGATVAYGLSLTDRVTATAAVGIDGIMFAAPAPDIWEASMLIGIKYRF